MNYESKRLWALTPLRDACQLPASPGLYFLMQKNGRQLYSLHRVSVKPDLKHTKLSDTANTHDKMAPCLSGCHLLAGYTPSYTHSAILAPVHGPSCVHTCFQYQETHGLLQLLYSKVHDDRKSLGFDSLICPLPSIQHSVQFITDDQKACV